jgi:uncharacterized protein YfiM (DUF2279 family)
MVAGKFILPLFLIPFLLSAQRKDSTDDQGINHKRLRTVLIAGTVGYGVAIVGLSEMWYKDKPRQSFQFFNDNAEWKQVDKLGHFYSSFYLSYGASKMFQWGNLPQKRSVLYGALAGFLLMLPIEILDGYSAAYGASTGDLIANAGGGLFFLGQNLAWNAIRIYPKFSYYPTDFASARPEVLGDTFTSRMLKDYNGQTYWLSFDMDKFCHFPKWLNLALGYGATNMVYARDAVNAGHGYDARRQYYISFDPDLTAIRTHSKALKTALFVVSMIKLPSPTIAFSKDGTSFHFLY